MSDSESGAVLLILVATISAAIWHWRVRDHWRATSMSAVQAGLTFLAIVVVMEGGVRDPLIAIAGLFAMFWSFVIAYLVGLVFRAYRRPA